MRARHIGSKESSETDSRRPTTEQQLRRRPAEPQITYWLKVLALAALSWLILERLAGYAFYVNYVVVVAVGGLLLAYLFYPMVRFFNERLPLWLSIAIVYVLFASAVGFAGAYILPFLANDLQRLASQMPALVSQAQAILSAPNAPVVSHLPAGMRHSLVEIPAQIGTLFRSGPSVWTGNVLTILQSMFSVFAVFVLVPVVSIYMLNEAASIKRTFLGMLLPSARQRAKDVLEELDGVLSGFVRGQLIVALIIGVLVTALLLALRIPYALLIGVWAGVLEVVPYLGAVAGGVVGVFLALLTKGWMSAALVSVGFAAIYQLEGAFIAPGVQSRAVRITPLAAIFALIIGGELFGILGVLIACPVAGAIRVLVQNAFPPEELTNVEVEPGLTKAPHAVVHPLSTTTDVTTDRVEAAMSATREKKG